MKRSANGVASQLRRRRARPGDKWHLDEVFLTIRGVRHYLWRAVDQDGHVLDISVQRRRDKQAAKKFFRKLLKGLTYVPRVIVTDQLASYGAAKREHLPGVEHRPHRYVHNRAEHSHQPTRQRERRKVSSPQGTPNASSRRTGTWLNTFGRHGIDAPRRHTAKRDSKDFTSGARSPA